MSIVATLGSGDLLAWCAALPLLGVGGAWCAGFLSHRFPARGLRLLAGVGGVVVAGLAAAVWLWQAVGAPCVGVPLGDGWWGGLLVVDASRLHGAWLLTLAALLACARAGMDGTLAHRAFAGGIAWSWALGIWIMWLSNGPVRAWACVVWALSLLPLLLGGATPGGRSRAALCAIGPHVGAALLWLVLESAAPGATWPRLACAAVWLCALPLPGVMRSWSEGAPGGVLFAQCAGGIIAVLLVGDGAQAPWAAALCAASALVAGAGALTAQRASSYLAFALIACMQQGAAAVFLGDRTAALVFLSFFPFGAFALCAAALPVGRGNVDIREREATALPRAAGWCLAAGFFGIVGGIVPGPVLGVHLVVLAGLWRGGAWGLLGIAAMLAGTSALLIGCMRWAAWRDGGPGTDVPPWVRSAFTAFAAALVVPVIMQCLFVRGLVAGPSLFIAAALLAPAASAAALVRWGRGEGVTCLWEWASVRAQEALHALTGPAAAATCAGVLGAIARTADRTALVLCTFVVTLLHGAGALARRLERARW